MIHKKQGTQNKQRRATLDIRHDSPGPVALSTYGHTTRGAHAPKHRTMSAASPSRVSLHPTLLWLARRPSTSQGTREGCQSRPQGGVRSCEQVIHEVFDFRSSHLDNSFLSAQALEHEARKHLIQDGLARSRRLLLDWGREFRLQRHLNLLPSALERRNQSA